VSILGARGAARAGAAAGAGLALRAGPFRLLLETLLARALVALDALVAMGPLPDGGEQR
jgi:hypothetical protein